jgi:quinol monooxygenase YgiN
MYQLHITHTVNDFDAWHAVFAGFEDMRAAQGVTAYRVARPVDEPGRVVIDLDFDDLARARAFIAILETIWASPQAQEISGDHQTPTIHEVVQDRVVAAPTG